MTQDFHQHERYKHCQSLLSKAWDHQTKDELCDIAIKVDSKVFHCHRVILSAASAYFRAMFTGGFGESSAKEVTLHGVDANTFDRLLQFIYTGIVVIDRSNVCDFIHAAQFYGLASLEEQLVAFAKNNVWTLPREDVLRMFTSANVMAMRKLHTLLCEHIYQNIGPFSCSSDFVKLPWDNVQEFLALASVHQGSVLSDTFVEGILKWTRGQVNASAGEKLSCIDQLCKIVHRTNSFTNYVHDMIERYVSAEQAPPGRNAVDVLDERPSKLLRALVTTVRNNVGFPATSSIFTLYELNAGPTWAYSGECDWSRRFSRNIVVGDSLYALMRTGYDKGPCAERRAFVRASHVSMYQCQSLSPPPVFMDDFDMCGMHNNIFAYNKTESWLSQAFLVTSHLSIELLSRGLYMYKRDVDQWFVLPHRREAYSHSCMTCDERLVYLIGGKNSNGHVQAYDVRTSAWMDLAPTASAYKNAACCVRDGKIWVVGGEMNPVSVEIFDPVAGTWERGKDLTRQRRWHSRLVNWDSVHHGRTVVSFQELWCPDQNVLFSDDRHPSGWSGIPSLADAFKNNRIILNGYASITDMVAF